MTHVNQEMKTQWGSYSDRENSFDDSEDINKFLEITQSDEPILGYFRNFIEKGDYYWKPHPDGKYGVDLALIGEDGERIANFDLERWSAWKYDWPDFYKAIHFLGRKEKFLNKGVPFFMCYLNFNRDRVLIVDEQTINKYPTVEKHFKNKNVTDTLKRIPLSLGSIFGRYTQKESTLFRT